MTTRSELRISWKSPCRAEGLDAGQRARSGARNWQVHTGDGGAQGDPGQPVASRDFVVEVRAGI
jgi:hypothetical protein